MKGKNEGRGRERGQARGVQGSELVVLAARIARGRKPCAVEAAGMVGLHRRAPAHSHGRLATYPEVSNGNGRSNTSWEKSVFGVEAQLGG